MTECWTGIKGPKKCKQTRKEEMNKVSKHFGIKGPKKCKQTRKEEINKESKHFGIKGPKKCKQTKKKKKERINNNNQLVNIQLKIDESGIIKNI